MWRVIRTSRNSNKNSGTQPRICRSIGMSKILFILILSNFFCWSLCKFVFQTTRYVKRNSFITIDNLTNIILILAKSTNGESTLAKFRWSSAWLIFLDHRYIPIFRSASSEKRQWQGCPCHGSRKRHGWALIKFSNMR